MTRGRSRASGVGLDISRSPGKAIADQAFAALAEPVRLRLLSFIASADGEVYACDLAEPSGQSQPTVSRHMKALVDAGLGTREKRGLWVWYRAAPDRIDAPRAVLA